MSVVLDLADIQGNILEAYPKQGYFKGRTILLNIGGDSKTSRAANGRHFVTRLLPRVTTALAGASVGDAVRPPAVAVNVAFTFYGLLMLGVPTRTLRGLPDEFIDGMAARARMLGDDFSGDHWQEKWDTVWQNKGKPPEAAVHILIVLNQHYTASAADLDATTEAIVALAAENGVSVLAGHNPPGKEQTLYQDISAIFDEHGRPTPKEHFGFSDGISDPVFEGQYPADKLQSAAIGQGAVDGNGAWRALAAGEFLLGYPDEAQEIPGAAMPLAFSRNGTFMAYRKLHEHVGAWNRFIGEQAEKFAAFRGIPLVEARETLLAKMAGRWSDGVPLMKAKDFAEWQAFNEKFPQNSPERERELVDFTYRKDIDGEQCPMTSHTRRVNTRDALDPWVQTNPKLASGSVLNNRRRILRRGLPYGSSGPEATDDGDHGIVMLVVCSSLARQFEFVQQQWIHYGLDANAGNDTCPIVGNHSQGDARNGPKAKFVVPSEQDSGKPPYVAEGLPQFVETRGGEYFFVPSLTALRMIGMGTVDPT
ncbi:Dyp-type peroxidase [Methylosinus sporium]|uniref:Dyp-type peroxidase n=1 Tax=Methylosinus sporium TaxID=428 RepID=UPI00383A8C34